MSALTCEHEYSALSKNGETVYDYIDTTVSHLELNGKRSFVKSLPTWIPAHILPWLLKICACFQIRKRVTFTSDVYTITKLCHSKQHTVSSN